MPNSAVVENGTTMLQPDDWEISPEGIIMDEKLGEGAFGEVYKGIVAETYNNPRIEGFLKKNSNGYVAVKFLKGESQFISSYIEVQRCTLVKDLVGSVPCNQYQSSLLVVCACGI